MFGFIMRFFPRRAKSLEDFISAADTSGCKKVVVEPYMTCRGMDTRTATVGRLGNVEYAVEITAKTAYGRKIVRRYSIMTRFQSTYGAADRSERQKSAIKMYLVAEQAFVALKEQLHGVRVELIGPNDCPMDDNKFEQLHRDAIAAGVTV